QLEQHGVVQLHADGGAGLVIGNLKDDLKIGVGYSVVLGNGGLNEGAVQAAGHQLGDDVGHTDQRGNALGSSVLLGEILLDGAALAADLILGVVDALKVGEQVGLVLGGDEA